MKPCKRCDQQIKHKGKGGLCAQCVEELTPRHMSENDKAFPAANPEPTRGGRERGLRPSERRKGIKPAPKPTMPRLKFLEPGKRS